MTRGLLITLLLLLWTSAPASASPDEVPAPGMSQRVDAIKQRGRLRAAVLDEYPWLRRNPSGGTEPFHGPGWVVARALASRLGVPIETVPVDFDSKTAVLGQDQADITIAPLLATPGRNATIDLVPYSSAAHCVFGLASNAKVTRARTLDDLNRPDVTIATIAGSPQGAWLEGRLPKTSRVSAPGTLADLATEPVESGRADVAPIDKFFFAGLVKRHPEFVTVPPGQACMQSSELALPIASGIAKGQPAFLTWVRAVTAEVRPQIEAEEATVIRQGP